MTAKEKAIQFVWKFYSISDIEITYSQAKECALIAVEEILNELDLQNHLLRDYWYDVQHEIERL